MQRVALLDVAALPGAPAQGDNIGAAAALCASLSVCIILVWCSGGGQARGGVTPAPAPSSTAAGPGNKESWGSSTSQQTAPHLLPGRKEQRPFQGKCSALGSVFHQSGVSTNEQKAPEVAAPLNDTPGVQNLLFHLTAMTQYPASISVTDNQISCLPFLY